MERFIDNDPLFRSLNTKRRLEVIPNLQLMAYYVTVNYDFVFGDLLLDIVDQSLARGKEKNKNNLSMQLEKMEIDFLNGIKWDFSIPEDL